MAERDFGGNIVREVELDRDGTLELAREPYFFLRHGSASEFALAGPRVGLLYFDAPATGTMVEVDGAAFPARGARVVEFEATQSLRISFEGERAGFFLAGVTAPVPPGRRFVARSLAEVKKVVKPWGHELWLAGEHPHFLVKEIFARAGTKTSLQYHEQKRETLVFLEGEARLHYKQNPAANNDQVTPADLATAAVGRGCLIDVFPRHLHRMEAVSDILFLEASTPQGNDVIRVSDDAHRPNGRIAEEHRGK